ncbi:serine hydrolase domain-containing protein [Balneolaceae bacterium ANBcel3]|nr:serine hydrolase domain-containing protein [Balneolaceae bacterium ANBcel3]
MRDEKLTRTLESPFQNILKKKGIDHVSAAVATGNGSFYWNESFGTADENGRPMDTETPFFIASVTKLFIAASIFILRDRGRLDLNSPLPSLLPASMCDRLHIWKKEDLTDRITPMHLLCHASGLPDWLADRNNILKNGFTDRYYSIEDAVRHVREEMTPHFPPSDVFGKRVKIRYSDTGYQLLIAIIEHVLEKPVEEAFKELVLDPADLQHTWFAGKTPPDGVKEPALIRDGSTSFPYPALLASSRDLYSTCDDLLIFYRAVQNGLLFDSVRTRDDMQFRWNRFGVPGFSGAIQSPGWPIEYAAGTMRFRTPWLFRLFGTYPELTGHTGVTGSWLFYNRAGDFYCCGTVSQIQQASFPFRMIPDIASLVARHINDAT